jgi:Bacterial Ig-like domain
MKIGRLKSWVALGLVSCAMGCAGNGMGLDQNGQPIGSGGSTGGPVTADFQSIQDNVFTPICSVCHIGAGAPEGLQLDAAHSYNLLVGVPSAEVPTMLRVKPGDPTNSYIVHKLKGPPGIVGNQMPLNETPLSQATQAAISQWIANGAPNAAAAAASSFEIEGTVPLDHEMVDAPPPRIVVTFTQEVDASLINESTITVQRMANPRLDPGSPMASGTAGGAGTVSVTRALAGLNPSVLLITPNAPLAPGTYRVTVRGSGGGAVANLRATTLGSDQSFEFTVEPAR